MGEVISYGSTVAVQVIILFVLIFAGLILSKRKVLTKVGIDQFIDFLLYIVTPCVIINSFITVEFNKNSLTQLLIAAGCAFLTHFIGIIVALVFCKVKPISKQAVYRFGVIFSNGGFMSLPMAQALVGPKGVFLVSTYVITINIVTWTYGITLFKSEEKTSKLKAFFNPGVLGVLIGLPMFFMPYDIPSIIAMPIGYFAAINTPIAMIITGYFLLSANLKSGLKDKLMWVTAFLRLLAVPTIAFVLFKLVLGLSGDLLVSCMIPACAPCAVNNMMISAKFKGDTALASRLISITTLLSVITMPIILMMTKI